MKTDTEIEMGPFVEVSTEAWVGEGCRLGSHCHVQAGAVLTSIIFALLHKSEKGQLHVFGLRIRTCMCRSILCLCYD